MRPLLNLSQLESWDPDSGTLNVIVETVQGSRNKLRFDPLTGGFVLSNVLPRGEMFRFDFGFVPGTVAPDGDPLDVLILMDEGTVPGCRVPCRLIGVIEAEQEKGGKKVRNDRLIAVAVESREHHGLKSLKDVNQTLEREIEHFFTSYHAVRGKKFKVIDQHGPKRAEKILKEAVKRARRGKRRTETNGHAGKNGKLKAGKHK